MEIKSETDSDDYPDPLLPEIFKVLLIASARNRLSGTVNVLSDPIEANSSTHPFDPARPGGFGYSDGRPLVFLSETLLHAINIPTGLGDPLLTGHKGAATFGEKYWQGLGKSLHKWLEPCLRLAGRFICHEKCLPFWSTLAYGRRHSVADPTDSNKTAYLHIKHISDDHKKYLSLWAKTAPKIQLKFNKFEDPPVSDTGTPSKYVATRLRNFGDESSSHTILLHTDFLTVIETLSKGSGLNKAVVARFSFWLARVLVREFAYIMEYESLRVRNVRRGHQPGREEPPTYWMNSNCTDAGIMFEHVVLGGTISPISWRLDAMHGLALCSWDPAAGRLCDMSYAVPMEYIMEIQSDDVWLKPGSVGEINNNPLRVPVKNDAATTPQPLEEPANRSY